MRLTLILAALATTALPYAVHAQEAAPEAAAARAGRVAYPPSYFASSNPATALDMINRLPGFQLDTGSNARGYSGTGGNVLINGDRPATKSDPLDEILRRTPASAVERVELIYAGTPGVDMQGRSVLANIVLREQARTERVLNLSTYVYPDLYFGPTFEYQVSRSQGQNVTEGAFKIYTDRTDLTSDDAYRLRYLGDDVIEYADLSLWDHVWGGNAKGSIQRQAFGGKYRINALIDNTRFHRTETVNIRYPDETQVVNDETYNDWSGELGGQFDRKFGAKLTGELTALQRVERSKYLATSDSETFDNSFGEDATSGESILRGVIRYARSETMSFEGGAEGAFNFLDSQTTYAEPGYQQDDDVRVEELRGEVFAKGSWRPSKKLSLEAGTRIEVSRISQNSETVADDGTGPETFNSEEEKDLVYIKPRFVAVWSPTDKDQFRFRIERTVGQLNFGDFVASTSLETGNVDARNPDLEPSRSWIFETAYERHFWEKGAAVITLRHEEIEDVVDLLPVGSNSAPGNIGEGTLDQLKLDLTVPTDRLGIGGGRVHLYSSWVKTEVTDPVTHTPRRISGGSPHVCQASFEQDIPNSTWSYGITAFCPQVEHVWRINQLINYETETQLETYVQWKPRKDLSIRVDWQNMTARTRSRERIVYDGPRDTGNIDFYEYRPVDFDSWLWIRIRKEF